MREMRVGPSAPGVGSKPPQAAVVKSDGGERCGNVGTRSRQVRLRQAIDTTTPTGRLVFHVFGSIAEFESEGIVERTKDEFAAARKCGRVGGRPPALSIERKFEDRRMRDQEGRSVSQIAATFGVSTATIQRVPFYPHPKDEKGPTEKVGHFRPVSIC